MDPPEVPELCRECAKAGEAVAPSVPPPPSPRSVPPDADISKRYTDPKTCPLGPLSRGDLRESPEILRADRPKTTGANAKKKNSAPKNKNGGVYWQGSPKGGSLAEGDVAPTKDFYPSRAEVARNITESEPPSGQLQGSEGEGEAGNAEVRLKEIMPALTATSPELIAEPFPHAERIAAAITASKPN